MRVTSTQQITNETNPMSQKDTNGLAKVSTEYPQAPIRLEKTSQQNWQQANAELPPITSEFTKLLMQPSSSTSTTGSASQTIRTTKQATWLTPGKLTTQRLEQFVSTILPTSV